MQIKLQLQDIERNLENIAKGEQNKSVGIRTGALSRSTQVSVQEDGVILTFNAYGLFLDDGVRGRLGGTTAKGFQKQSYQFRRTPKVEPLKPPYYNYGFGIAPRQWVERAIDKMNDYIVNDIEEDVVKQIEEYFLQQTGNKINLQIKL
jgi:hypothetical protein